MEERQVELLKQRILQDGLVLSEKVLKVDTFLNHQVDPILMQKIGDEFARRFEGEGITKILTLEASGIAPALMTALSLNLPLIFAKKKPPLTFNNQEVVTANVYSFTKQETNTITISKKFINQMDKVLIIDDFLANGEASLGLIHLIEQTGASVIGVGIVIEKSFQMGREKLEEVGYRVESLARIQSLTNHSIQFLEEVLQK